MDRILGRIEGALLGVDDWIPVREGLPEDGDKVLVCYDRCTGTGSGVEKDMEREILLVEFQKHDLDHPFDHWRVLGTGTFIFSVTHWMPRPRLPQER